MSDLPPHYDSIKELGAYDQPPSDVQAQLRDLSGYSLPPSVTVKAEDAMTEHLKKSDTWKHLMEEAKVFGDNAVKVDEAFERVRKGLRQVDANDYKDKDGNPIPKLQSTWVDYQKRWTTLLWGSRDVAIKTEAYIKDFLEDIVPGVEDIKTKDDLDDARLDLDQFIKRKDPLAKQLNSEETVNLAHKYSQDFTDLKLDLETFQANFDRLFAHREVDLDSITITQKQAEKERLDQRTTMSQVYDRDTNSSRYTIFKFHIIGAIAALSELIVQRPTAQTRLEGLQAPLKDLQGIRAIFENNDIFLDICGRLDRFADIWRLVRHDAELIRSGLCAVLVDNQGPKKVLKKRTVLI